MTKLDVIVIGAGHAGCEAACAAARLGCTVGLCTISADTVALMPCNPAIGGTAKGHLVREIDALGGLMGQAIDATGIQFKMLNRSRGPAVWSPRAQADKAAYSAWVRQALKSQPNIEWLLGRVGAIVTSGGRVVGLETEEGRTFRCQAIIVTTGTFLNGVVHVGPEQRPAGRAGEPPSQRLAEWFRDREFCRGRLKTGTPPRLLRQSIDFDEQVSHGVFHVEHGDAQPIPFSYMSEIAPTNRAACHVLHTTPSVHALLRAHIDESPLYNGRIAGIGPRYCPSFEDKVMRFPDRERHQIILEPEGLTSDEIYVNGLSMSLPSHVQADLVHALPGLESARMVRPGYAVEYDFVQPTELSAALESRRVPGLFLAGQINGTSGYEEAAGQGLLAGINAACRVRGRSGLVLGRHEAYLGVMIDDLVTKGCLEPYRLFTSRAEHRLLLRTDNADLRLTPRGREVGLVSYERWERFQARQSRFTGNLRTLKRTRVRIDSGARIPAAQALRRPDVHLSALLASGEVNLTLAGVDRLLDIASLETLVKYGGYLERQERAVLRARRDEKRKIPPTFSYRGVPGLSHEMVQRFEEVRPETLGQASRIPGVTPAAVAVLGLFVEGSLARRSNARERVTR
ncbi:MAG: tRNA uridine-5-carboxymethylaminomethyl(34) synthesis enzyme MnmG [Acidobacteria bacterium]|nr:tRNA uridine-5-carboxymethylaminomethyl(34) synthesis enzyme MnmG [Acidobacteriota bacterium]